jgi:hypothetical protein
MFAALKSVMKWLVYAGLVAVAVGLMLVGKVDIVLVERLSLRINDAAIPVLEVLSRPVDAMLAGLARVRSWTDLAEENAPAARGPGPVIALASGRATARSREYRAAAAHKHGA